MTETKTDNDFILYSNMRTMISLVDRLRDFNLHEYISLPKITVLGDQSAGKSSILESICGMNFLPRGSGIVTRRPLELRLIRQPVQVPYFVFPKDFPNQKFVSQEEVRKKIEELTDRIAGVDKFISDVPIVLTVYSSSVPDLSLVDLPGITRVPTGKQPQNIEEITKNLIRKYCSDPNSLILCVISANVDLSTSDSLMFARQLDPSGSRTLGVLTKIDLMDEGCDCKRILMNQEIPLNYGFVGVKGRSQKEVMENKKVSDAINSELDFFARHPVYSTLPSDVLGTRSLVDKVSTILYDMIKTALPKIKTEIMERKRKAKDQIEAFGEEVPETDEKRQEAIFKMVRAFKENFDQEITGKYYYESLIGKSQKEKIKRSGETITFQLNELFNALYEEYTQKGFRITKDYTDDYIRNAMEVYQGDSMPGFQSFDSFLFLINPKMRLLTDPVFNLLEDAKNILETRGSEILETIFKKHPRLLSEVKETFLKVLTTTRNSARKIADNLLRCNENYWFTNDPYMVEGTMSVTKGKTTGRDLMAIELRSRIEKYFYIVVRNIRNTIPKIIGSFLLRKLSENLEVSILNSLSRKNYCIDVFDENSTVAETRKKLRVELNALTQAENLLINEFGMGFNLNTEVSYDKRMESSMTSSRAEMDTALLADIESMNDDYLQFNRRLLNLKGKTETPVTGNAFARLQHPSHRPSQNSNYQAQPAQVVAESQKVSTQPVSQVTQPQPKKADPTPQQPQQQNKGMMPDIFSQTPNPNDPRFQKQTPPVVNNNDGRSIFGPQNTPFSGNQNPNQNLNQQRPPNPQPPKTNDLFDINLVVNNTNTNQNSNQQRPNNQNFGIQQKPNPNITLTPSTNQTAPQNRGLPGPQSTTPNRTIPKTNLFGDPI